MFRYNKLELYWKNIDFFKMTVEIKSNDKLNSLNIKSEYVFLNKTKMNFYLNTIIRYCKIYPQKILEKNDMYIYVTANINNITIQQKISNIDDIEIVFRNLEDNIVEKLFNMAK